VDGAVAAKETEIGVRLSAHLIASGWTRGWFVERQRLLHEWVGVALSGDTAIWSGDDMRN
jgi:hypothetical protein